MSADANHEGFRILRTDPVLFPMELLWRWSFGLGLLALAFFAYPHLRQAILLSNADELALTGQDPFAIAETAARVLAEALPPLLATLAQFFAFVALLWIVASALGRGIISRLIVRRFAAESNLPIAPDAPRWTAFAALQSARVLMLLILVIGYLGGAFLAESLKATDQNFLLPSLIVFASLAISCVLWSYVNWILSLAPIFLVRDGLSPLDSITAAIAFLRRNHSRLTAIALWNSTLRGVAATLISIAGVSTVALRSTLPPWAVPTLLVLQTLLYLIVSDLFLLARLGAYASVAVRERAFSQSLPAPPARSGVVTH